MARKNNQSHLHTKKNKKNPKHIEIRENRSYSAHGWPAGGGVVSMVRFSLGGAYRCRCGWSGPLHQPQGLEGVVVQALLGEEAFGGVEQQQVLTHTHTQTHRGRRWVLETPRTSRPRSGPAVSHSIIIKVRLLLLFFCVLQSPNTTNNNVRHVFFLFLPLINL